MDGADRRAVRQHAEISRQMLDRIVGQQCDAVVGVDSLAVQVRRDAACHPAQLLIAQRAAIIRRDNKRLVRVARRGAVDPVAQQLRARLLAHGFSPRGIILRNLSNFEGLLARTVPIRHPEVLGALAPSLEGRRPGNQGPYPSRLARCARSHLRMTDRVIYGRAAPPP
jgi:hypothetical protein